MDITKSICSIISKAWHLFMTVIVPTMKNKEVVEETATTFTKMLADKYPGILDQIGKATDKYVSMADKVGEGLEKMGKLYELFYAARNDLQAARLISCKAAPTCINVVK